MANKHRGEIAAQLDSKSWTLCLPLGALAELENHFKVDSLMELAKRLGSGEFSSVDLLAILNAGLKGGGHALTIEEVGELRSASGVTGYTQIVVELLQATFTSSTAVSAQEKASAIAQ